MNNNVNKQDGFTLLELVIVIVAIVILAVLVFFSDAMPSFSLDQWRLAF